VREDLEPWVLGSPKLPVFAFSGIAGVVPWGHGVRPGDFSPSFGGTCPR